MHVHVYVTSCTLHAYLICIGVISSIYIFLTFLNRYISPKVEVTENKVEHINKYTLFTENILIPSLLSIPPKTSFKNFVSSYIENTFNRIS